MSLLRFAKVRTEEPQSLPTTPSPLAEEVAAASNNAIATTTGPARGKLANAILPYAAGLHGYFSAHDEGLPASLLSAEAKFLTESQLLGTTLQEAPPGDWEIVYAASESGGWLNFGLPKTSAIVAPCLSVSEDGRISLTHNGVSLHASLADQVALQGTFDAVQKGTSRAAFDAVTISGVNYSGEHLRAPTTQSLLDIHEISPLIDKHLTIAPFHIEEGHAVDGWSPLAAAKKMESPSKPTTSDVLAARLSLGSDEALVLMRRGTPVPIVVEPPPAVRAPVAKVPAEAAQPKKDFSLKSLFPKKKGQQQRPKEWDPTRLRTDQDGYYLREGDDRRRTTRMGAQMGGYDSPMQLLDEEGQPMFLFLALVSLPPLLNTYAGRLWHWQMVVATELLARLPHVANDQFFG